MLRLVVRRWARRRGVGLPLWPAGIVGVVTFLVGWGVKDGLGDLVKRIVKAIFGDLLGPNPMSDFVATWGGVSGLAILAMLVFLAGYVYAGLRKPELFLSRDRLDASNPDPFKNVTSVCAVLFPGQKFLERSAHIPAGRIRLILPEPKARSVSYLQSTFNFSSDHKHLQKVIDDARGIGIQVRVCPEFSGSSWWIGNRQGDDPFVHIEVLLPFIGRPYRPSFRVYRTQDQEFFDRYCEAFDKLWEASKEQQK